MKIRTVMLVDDEPDIRTIGEMSLSAVGGWEVTSVASGVEALEVAAASAPDLILLDVMMPELDGPATLQKLRDVPQLAHVPIVFLTAKVQRREVERYLELGAAGVIAKPFDPMTLPDQLRRLVEQA